MPANTGTDRHTDAFGVCFGHFDTGVFESLTTRRDTVMHETIHALGIFLGDIIPYVQILDHTAKGGCETRYIKRLYGAYAASTVDNPIPGIGNIIR